MKDVMRFGKKGKLSPRYIGPYRISKRMGTVAYELELPQELATIPVQILDRQVRKLRTKEVASVKVLWMNQFVEEATWEADEDMKKRYPHLFETGENADQGSASGAFVDPVSSSESVGEPLCISYDSFTLLSVLVLVDVSWPASYYDANTVVSWLIPAAGGGAMVASWSNLLE
ncbi:hypothetical protein MTR67_047279 [Solanum verrucosum]|uniref:Chromo domain-containing protein n=1 Tax=Solanum verrucosum TaxID=315347 RepID=A0AAF0UYK8_SOLVR|nr:hypothetical protein MTR67_047279 [Solanum verrucosum]